MTVENLSRTAFLCVELGVLFRYLYRRVSEASLTSLTGSGYPDYGLPCSPSLQLALHERIVGILTELNVTEPSLPPFDDCSDPDLLTSVRDRIFGELASVDPKITSALMFADRFPPQKLTFSYPDDWYIQVESGFVGLGRELGIEEKHLHHLAAYDLNGNPLAQVNYLKKALFGAEQPQASTLFAFKDFDLKLYQALQESPELLNSIHWRDFERLLTDLLSRFGYEIELQRGTKDGGVDILAIARQGVLGPERHLVQAKRWSNKIGVAPVRELLFLHQHYGATKSCLATTSYFTKGAWQLAQEYKWSLYLRDLAGISDWIAEAVRLETVNSKVRQ